MLTRAKEHSVYWLWIQVVVHVEMPCQCACACTCSSLNMSVTGIVRNVAPLLQCSKDASDLSHVRLYVHPHAARQRRQQRQRLPLSQLTTTLEPPYRDVKAMVHAPKIPTSKLQRYNLRICPPAPSVSSAPCSV